METSIFTNETIKDLNLPDIHTEEFVPIHPKYKGFLFFRNTLSIAVLSLIVFAVYWLPDVSLNLYHCLMIGLSVFLLWAFSIVNVMLNFPQKSYLIREKDISYKKGYFFRKITTVPLNRIQHVEISQSPLVRMFGLSKVVIYTAGGSSSDIAIPGLLPQKAEEIKQYLSQEVAKDSVGEDAQNMVQDD